MSSREQILSAVRAGLGGQPLDPARVKLEADRLLDDVPAARPALAALPVIDVFSARLVSPKVAASMDRVAHVSELPAAVARYLDARGLARAVALQPAEALRALDWQDIELHDAPAVDEVVGVGLANGAIAETGSLVFHSGAESPVLAHFLPLHHLVLLRARTIVPYLEDYAAAALGPGRGPFRNVNLITGASGTTDIEGSLVLGAHGPRYLHVVVALNG